MHRRRPNEFPVLLAKLRGEHNTWRTSVSWPFSSRTGSLDSPPSTVGPVSGAGADIGVVGAGDLDLGDFPRFAPFLLVSGRALREVEVEPSMCCVSNNAAWRTNTDLLKPGQRTVSVLFYYLYYTFYFCRPLAFVWVSLLCNWRARLALLRGVRKFRYRGRGRCHDDRCRRGIGRQLDGRLGTRIQGANVGLQQREASGAVTGHVIVSPPMCFHFNIKQCLDQKFNQLSPWDMLF